MAKRKPPQPHPANMIALNGGSPDPRSDGAADSSGPHFSSQDHAFQSHEWHSATETNAAYARLDNQARDFVFGISRGYSVRHACRMAGEDYERMLDSLNNRSRFYKPDLFKLVEKARAVAYARSIEKLNASPDWHAAAFWLERRERKEFAPPRDNIENEDHPERKALIRMSKETLDALSEAYDAEHGTADQEHNSEKPN